MFESFNKSIRSFPNICERGIIPKLFWQRLTKYNLNVNKGTKIENFSFGTMASLYFRTERPPLNYTHGKVRQREVCDVKVLKKTKLPAKSSVKLIHSMSQETRGTFSLKSCAFSTIKRGEATFNLSKSKD